MMITKDMILAEVIRQYPRTLPVFQKFGLDCRDCQLAATGSVENCGDFHDLDIDQLIRELNEAIQE